MDLLKKILKPFKITDGKTFCLRDFDPADTGGISDKKDAQELLQQSIEHLRGLQKKLYAQDEWAILLIFQAMDAAGKDSAIKNVMTGINPQGCQVFSFKQPSPEELNHDFLWRTACRLPERGRIGIFNRSYYEEVLTVRVHPDLLKPQRLPLRLRSEEIFSQRLQSIRDHERHLYLNGTVTQKFFLNISKKEQRRRLLRRLDDPDRNWKFSSADIRERSFWSSYMRSYEDAIRQTATPSAPWYVVPADHKWFSGLVIAAALIETMEELDLAFPKINAAKRKELKQARKLL